MMKCNAVTEVKKAFSAESLAILTHENIIIVVTGIRNHCKLCALVIVKNLLPNLYVFLMVML